MDIKDCLRLPEDKEAFACMKKVLKSPQGSCPSRLVLLLEHDGCEPCEQALTQYAEDIKEEAVQVVSIASEEGRDIIRQNNIEYAPALIVLDCQNKIIDV